MPSVVRTTGQPRHRIRIARYGQGSSEPVSCAAPARGEGRVQPQHQRQAVIMSDPVPRLGARLASGTRPDIR